jgi:hypothetical protein
MPRAERNWLDDAIARADVLIERDQRDEAYRAVRERDDAGDLEAVGELQATISRIMARQFTALEAAIARLDA